MIENIAAEKIALWRNRPDVFVKEVFGATPDPWQDEVLKAFPTSPRIALKASKGPGKSCLLAWLSWNFLLTRPFPKLAAVSITGDNLRDGLWSEMAKWREQSPLLKEAFIWQRERIFAKDYPETWWMAARQWNKAADANALGNTLAGLHADYIMFLLDESGGMPDAIMASAEAALSSCKEGHLIQAGNPTHLEGPLYRACMKERDLWFVVEITSDPDSPRRSPRVDPKWAMDQIKMYGRDNPWVLVNVFGQFPPSSFNALIGPDEVKEATIRVWKEQDYGKSPRILGIDCARYGDDCLRDDTEVLTNNGWKFFPDLNPSDKVLSVEPNSSKASWENIDEIVSYNFDGLLNEYSSRSLDFSCTDNHRFLIKSNPKSSLFKFEQYKNLPLDFIIRDSNGWSGKNPDKIKFVSSREMPNGGLSTKEWEFDYLDWSSFLGWFVSEGNVYKEKRKYNRLRVIVSQNPGHKQEQIKDLLTKMGINWRVCSNKKQLEFSNNEIGKWLIEHCGVGAPNKKIPITIKESSEESINNFLETFRLGDGTTHKNGKGSSYITSSMQLANDLQECLFKVGRAGSLKLKEKSGSNFYIGDREVIRKHDTYVVYERTFQNGKRVDKRKVKQVPYKGKVWCVRTKHQSFVIRRNGKPMWSGNSSIIFPRQGLQAFTPSQYRNLDGTQGAETAIRKWDEWEADACFIDNTGGFGASWIDNLIRLGKDPIGVHFSETQGVGPQYYNRRAEMAFKLVEWIKRGGAIPECRELSEALTQTTYTFKGEKLIIEPKEDLKSKLGYSPDHMDALMLTFASPIDRRRDENTSFRGMHQFDYNPLDRKHIRYG